MGYKHEGGRKPHKCESQHIASGMLEPSFPQLPQGTALLSGCPEVFCLCLSHPILSHIPTRSTPRSLCKPESPWVSSEPPAGAALGLLIQTEG